MTITRTFNFARVVRGIQSTLSITLGQRRTSSARRKQFVQVLDDYADWDLVTFVDEVFDGGKCVSSVVFQVSKPPKGI